MAEPTVQVPVSLIEDLHARWHDEPGNMLGRSDCGWQGCTFYDAAEFVLSQPTLSAERDDLLGCLELGDDGHNHWDIDALDRLLQRRMDGLNATPPRIEDMAPGTMLVGALHEVFSDNRPMRLMVVKRRRRVDVVDPDGCFWMPSDINPSTIRDVRASKETTA